MLEELAQRRASLRDIVSALVRPLAARFDDPDGGVCYIKISAHLAASNLREFSRQASSPHREADWGPDMNPLWQPFLKNLPRAVLAHRMSLMVSLLFHGLADHAAHREQGDAELANTPLMVNNLIDSICAMLSAPVSAETRALTPPE